MSTQDVNGADLFAPLRGSGNPGQEPRSCSTKDPVRSRSGGSESFLEIVLAQAAFACEAPCMKPIFLTLTKHTAATELCEMAHPNEIEAVGTMREMGKRGLRVIVRHKGQTWQVKRTNNTEFAKRLDGVKKAAGIPYDHAEGERWLDDAARVIAAGAMWK